MKSCWIGLLFSSILFVVPLKHVFAGEPDTSNTAIITTIKTGNDDVKNMVAAGTAAITDSLAKIKLRTMVEKSPGIWERTIALLPVILYVFIMAILLRTMKKDGISLRDILLDKEAVLEDQKQKLNAQTAMPTIVNTPALNAFNTATDPATEQPQSVNRFIAFMSALVSVALAVCICTFYMYQCFSGNKNPDISNLTNVLYGLGLGVIPYGVSKIASMFK